MAKIAVIQPVRVPPFKKVLRDAMKASGIKSQAELSRRSTVAQAHISRYLSGQSIPTEVNLTRLEAALPRLASMRKRIK